MGLWRPIGSWTASNQFSWTPTKADAAYRVSAWVKRAANAADEAEASAERPFAITAAASTSAPPRAHVVDARGQPRPDHQRARAAAGRVDHRLDGDADGRQWQRWSINGSSTSSGCGGPWDRGPRRINSAGRRPRPMPPIGSRRGSRVRPRPRTKRKRHPNGRSRSPRRVRARTGTHVAVARVASLALTTNVPAPQRGRVDHRLDGDADGRSGGAGLQMVRHRQWCDVERDRIVDLVESIHVDAHGRERELSRLGVGQAREPIPRTNGKRHRHGRSRSPRLR